MKTGEVLAEVRRLRRSFGDRIVLQDVSLTLRAGEVTGFVGANGAGKTTTIRLMLGLARGEGSTLFLGRPLHAWGSPAKVVGAVLGGVAGHPKHRVRSHLRMVAAGCGAPDRRVDELLEQVGLTEAAKLRLAQLSLGMTQRVGIAQALLGDPRVLILDEPANGLDPHSIRWLRQFLRTQADEGRAVLVSSHLLGEMEQLADTVVVLSRGRVVAASPLTELRTAASNRSVVLVQTPNMAGLARLVEDNGGRLEPTDQTGTRITGMDRIKVGSLAAKEGLELHWLSEETPTLEDFYLSIAEEDFKIT